MKSRKVVLMYSDTDVARRMSKALGSVSWECAIASSGDDLPAIAGTHNVNCVIVDLEAMTIAQVKDLQERCGVPVICVHRNASDSMWIDSMSAGAVDCCYPDDWTAIHRALQRVKSARPMALASAA